MRNPYLYGNWRSLDGRGGYRTHWPSTLLDYSLRGLEFYARNQKYIDLSIGSILSPRTKRVLEEIIDKTLPYVGPEPELKKPRYESPKKPVFEQPRTPAPSPAPSIPRPVHSVKMPSFGVYRGRFRRGKRVGPSKALTLGYQETFQGGGVETKANGVEMGHAYPLARVLKCFCGAVVRLGFKNAGIEINDWTTAVPFPSGLLMRLVVRGGFDGAPLAYTVPLPGPTPSYLDMVNAMVVLIRSFDNDFLLYQLLINNENGTSDYVSETTIEDSIFVMNVTSVLTLQNRTQPVADSNTTEDVRANPLIIKKFTATGNGLIPRGTPFGPVYASADVGYIQGGLADNTKGMNAAQAYKNCRRTYSTTLDPGAIKKDKISWKFVGSPHKLMSALMNYISTNSGVTNVSRRCWLGSCSLFEMERLCDTRSAEPNISVGFELVGFIGGYLKTKRKSYVSRVFEDVGTITPS